MLQMKQVEPKSYEEMMEEAIRNIPLYSSEWTNFNPSDPGITILENLSAFNKLQQMSIDEVTPLIREKLFALAGFKRRPRMLSRVLLEGPDMGEQISLPANQKFMLGETPFETKHASKLSGAKLTAIYSKQGDAVCDISMLIDDQVPIKVKPFGDEPSEGSEILFVADHMPPANEECFFYITAADDYGRNPFPTEEKRFRMFATMKWEVLTEEGYVELASRDETGAFLQSGELRFRMPDEPFKPLYQSELPTPGYIIKGTLTRQSYDLPPVIENIHGFLFEVWQKETLSACFTFNQNNSVELYGELPAEGYLNVFCREEKSTSYRKYTISYDDISADNFADDGEDADDASFNQDAEGAKGRFYTLSQDDNGRVVIRFSKKHFGYGPARIKNAVKVVAYNEEAMRQYSLGTVYGYDNQIIELPFKRIVSDTFSVIAERTDETGLPVYDFVKPERDKEGALRFTVDEDAGTMTITDAGDYAGSRLFLCAVALSLGSDGNIRPGNHFSANIGRRKITFSNPAPGVSGCERESVNALQQRFLNDTREHMTAVSAQDYENLVMNIPGLCIHKVRAYESKKDHAVHIAVLPYTRDGNLALSDRYIAEIGDYVERHRMLGTVVKIENVCAAAVNVSLKIYIKSHFSDADNRIRKSVSEFLDARVGDKRVGGIIYMEELYKYLESLPYVKAVYELKINSGNARYAHDRDCDVVLDDNCVSIPGKIDIEIMK